jgi:hypothetical protein
MPVQVVCSVESSRSTSTVFDFEGYAPESLLDARRRQSNTKSFGGNIQRDLILGSTKTMCGCQCHGRLAHLNRVLREVV